MSGSDNVFRVYRREQDNVVGLYGDPLDVGDEFGDDGYPLEWHATIKYLVREQADHRCVRCGHPYRVGQTKPEWSPCDDRCTHGGPIRYQFGGGKWTDYGLICSHGWETVPGYEPTRERLDSALVEASWRVLTVHHLDGDKANCRWWNLVALCQRCHLSIQGKVKMERRWDRPHTAWFQPYVAAYYAWVYLRRDLTREETLARIDELLALEHFQQQLSTGGL